MNELGDKLVDFGNWCPKCKYFETHETELPCRDCLEFPTNAYSTKPVEFKAKEEDK